ncbi:MAG TPA: FAD-dependent monooxygenase [Nocardioides sp.]|uniref:FAD-dependent monooxygenase n=1 Tax=Nocardioides sp. TaxID=35761 RepID=UPI002E300F89|nr:FAD-dependent monooxygenase [Nocardioides sp.]HEX5087894.1 FAD-dependent monooxygenase [Nocardioides sp.]
MHVAGLRVLVVGAGVAGLAAARTLHGAGASVRVVERSDHPTAEGAGLYLPGNAVRALRELGLEAEVTERAHRIERQRFSDHRGRRLFEVEVEQVWSGVGACLALPRAELHAALLAGVGEVPVTWGTRPDDVTIDGQRVAVGLDDGSAGDYDLVLGADGVHSTVRRLAFDAAPDPRPVGQHARRFVVAAEPAGLDRTWSVLLGRGASFLTIPIAGGRLYCYCDGPADSAAIPLRELLAGYAAPVPDLLDLLEESPGTTIQEGIIEEVDLPTWSRGSVLLVGDAAHATSPNMAEGAAMALEDAIVLTESLTTAPDVASGITLFQQRRAPRTTWVRNQTHRRDRARSMPPVVRNPLLAGFGRHIFMSNYRPLREPA